MVVLLQLPLVVPLVVSMVIDMQHLRYSVYEVRNHPGRKIINLYPQSCSEESQVS